MAALPKNMGKLDKAIRTLIALGIALLYLFNLITGVVGLVLMSLAIILLLTSFFNFCPLYKVFGYDSCKFDPKE
jgi:hypothetical protein